MLIQLIIRLAVRTLRRYAPHMLAESRDVRARLIIPGYPWTVDAPIHESLRLLSRTGAASATLALIDTDTDTPHVYRVTESVL